MFLIWFHLLYEGSQGERGEGRVKAFTGFSTLHTLRGTISAENLGSVVVVVEVNHVFLMRFFFHRLVPFERSYT